MEHCRMTSRDLVQDNIDAIGSLFPNCLKEVREEDGTVSRKIDFEVLKQELSRSVIQGRPERYEFNWPGKRAAALLANTPIEATLRPCREESVNFDTTENLYIEGDNLDVLKLLCDNYRGKIKMIYIDPPYNTGNDFVYEDDFAQTDGEYRSISGDYDDQGNRLVKNSDSSGRFHTDWLNMMYPRLKIAQKLLTSNGIIMISIDDCEQDNLRKLCDEILGRENFIDTLIWKKRYGGGAKENFFVSLHEYILVYCKDIEQLNDFYVPISQESAERYYSLKDEKYPIRGGFRTHPLEAGKAMDARPNLVYPIPAPDGTQIMPKRQWLWSKERVMTAINNNEIYFSQGKDGWVVSSKQYLREENGDFRPAKMLSIIDDVFTQHGTNEITDILGNAKIFQYPKPSALIKKLVSVISETKEEIFLDFFSGSAVTAHAVMQLNAEDGGHRKFIMVQIPEVCEEGSEAAKAGYKNICEIGKERIRRAGRKCLDLRLKNLMNELGLESLVKEGILEQIVSNGEQGDKDARELSETGSLEEIYGTCRGDLSTCQEIAQRGDIRTIGPDETGGGVDTLQHSGRTSAGNKGIHPVFENGKGITCGTGNTIVDLHSLELLKQLGYRVKLESIGGSQQDDLFANSDSQLQTQLFSLNSKLSALSSKLSLDIGFRVLKLDSSNMRDVYYRPSELKQSELGLQEDNVKPDRTAEDLLFQVMLEKDIPLSSKIVTETVAGKTIYNVADGYLLACFDTGVTDEVVTAIAQKHPVYAVFRDAGMASDSTAINFEQLFATYSPDTKRSIL